MNYTLINKIISFFLVFLTCSWSPIMLVKKCSNQPKELVSLIESGVGSDADPVYCTAHRGVVSQAPENTLPAYEKAIENNYYAAECDIRLTSDNVWVLSHDKDINRCFWQYGEISEMTYSELCKCSYNKGSNFWKYENLKIPTLDEYLDLFIGKSTRPQIEIKSSTIETLPTILDALETRGLEKQAIIITFNYEQIKELRKLDSEIELWYLVNEIDDTIISQIKDVGGNTWIAFDCGDTKEEEIKKALSEGISLASWTVDSLKDAKKLYNAGVRYMTTNIFCK